MKLFYVLMSLLCFYQVIAAEYVSDRDVFEALVRKDYPTATDYFFKKVDVRQNEIFKLDQVPSLTEEEQIVRHSKIYQLYKLVAAMISHSEDIFMDNESSVYDYHVELLKAHRLALEIDPTKDYKFCEEVREECQAYLNSLTPTISPNILCLYSPTQKQQITQSYEDRKKRLLTAYEHLFIKGNLLLIPTNEEVFFPPKEQDS